MHVIEGVEFKGIATCYPRKIERTDDYVHFNTEEIEKFKKNVGIWERRVVDDGVCASDLCESACRDLMESLRWTGDDVDALIMITQTGDYPVPATSIILQNKIGIKNCAICFDINLGCSSFPFGLYTVSSLLKAGGIKKAILLIGDVSSKVCSIEDKSSYPLFGDAGCAIALQRIDLDNKKAFYFDLMSDGAGYKSIIIETGGLASRNPVNKDALESKSVSDGISRSEVNLVLKGADIFSFAISKVPASIKRIIEFADISIEEYDFLVLHQANKMINDQIVRKIKMSSEKVLSSLMNYGNTSSVSIPLTITANKDRFFQRESQVLASGFGVGLSWGSVSFNIPSNIVLIHKEFNDK
jgi:3-oxoacyl-[acyl-carrier-protein] synthase-3